MYILLNIIFYMYIYIGKFERNNDWDELNPPQRIVFKHFLTFLLLLIIFITF